MRALAERLLAEEKAPATLSRSRVAAAFSVCEKLRRPLTMLAGAAGYHSLLLRALTLARREAPSLHGVQVDEAGVLENRAMEPGAFNHHEDGPAGDGEVHHREANDAGDGGLILIAQMIGLLVTFIGEGLTLHLIEDVWPDGSIREPLAKKGTGKHESQG